MSYSYCFDENIVRFFFFLSFLILPRISDVSMYKKDKNLVLPAHTELAAGM